MALLTWQKSKVETYAIFIIMLFTLAAQEECGQRTPDLSKTCISIRLPWESKPIYFCVRKETFRYRNQCRSKSVSQCGAKVRNDSLLVSTPWECCPKISNPDNCVDQKCPSPPYNRKCEAIPPNDKQPWDCCSKYFCEENATPDTCQFRMMEQDCNTPPKGKQNCVAFIDPHGCCPKYQCDGDNLKEGQCPAQAEASKWMARYNTTSNNNEKPARQDPQTEASSDDDSPSSRSGVSDDSMVPQKRRKMAAMSIMRPPMPNGQNMMSCIGDFNCPGSMKCCSGNMQVYVKDGHYLKRNSNPTNGYCTDPVKKDK